MLQIYLEEKYKIKMVDFLLDLGIKDFYCLDLEHFLSRDLLFDEKDRVNGYTKSVLFILLNQSGGELRDAIYSSFPEAQIVA